jgi:hypothetical protein
MAPLQGENKKPPVQNIDKTIQNFPEEKMPKCKNVF